MKNFEYELYIESICFCQTIVQYLATKFVLVLCSSKKKKLSEKKNFSFKMSILIIKNEGEVF